jgi:MFS family permease
MTSERRTSLLVPTLVFVGLLVAIVSSLGAPMIPSIAQTNHVSLSTAQWVLTAALLTGALATPVMGRLADGSRQRAVIASTLSIVLAGCVLSAVSTSFVVLVIGRGLQGFGLGLLPVNMAIARRNLDRERAGRAIATLDRKSVV